MLDPATNPFAGCQTHEDVVAAVGVAGIERVQIGIFDSDAILRWKRVGRGKFEKLLTGGYSFCDVLHKWDITEEPYGSAAYSDAPCVIDPTSGRLSPDTPKEALFIADFAPPLGAASPRNLLQTLLAKADGLALTATSAVEYEFNVFEETPSSLREKGYRGLTGFQPHNRTYSAVTPATNDGLFDAIEDYVGRAGIGLDSMHCELGPGCFEFPLSATQGLRAADDAALFRLYTRILLERRGLLPVFMAKWSNDWPGQSGHLHLSLQDKNGDPVFHDAKDPRGLSPALRHFVGGLCRLLPEALAMIAHTVNAYRRLVPGAWAPIASSWGVQNRTAAVRVIGGSANETRVELRVPAADSNPHLVLAFALGAGLWGMENAVEPPAESEGDTYTQTFAPDLMFPRNLLEAADRLHASAVARQVFGDAFVDAFVYSRRMEDQAVRRAVTDVELRRYFEAF